MKEVLKLALIALERTNSEPGSLAFERELEAITAIKQALAAPVQEAVAWPCEIEEADFEQDTITLKMLTSQYVVRAGKHWLSATPPAAQRQWVGLTHEERSEIGRKHYARTLPLMYAVEDKLKQKNIG
jgi:hypothetical protein